ncbi:hypothetical protein ER308_14270 [Egibacter rhizosphaerae]|uniref:Aldose 1-epimerase n=1 Tax=Egibacter rhizosphaerae TaxID=1670831 RepID=A0A411YHL9_9ACTN|nr:hypothetical protein [Egibacter rhizosphaerae]QBI20609.1 hypothetical protein ER308_14270 [Egibacter rhizosphaerae]
MNGPVTLVAGEDRVTIDPAAGGRLTSFVAGGRERLLTAPGDPSDVDQRRSGWGCFLMAPWVGRLAQARLPDGRTVPATCGAHAIHGTALDVPWSVTGPAPGPAPEPPTSARLTCELSGGGWPWSASVDVEARIRPGELELVVTLTAHEGPMPAAVGWHPWFARPNTGDVALELAAERVLVTDGELLPDGTAAPAEGALDLRDAPPLGARRLDDCFIDVAEPARVRWPDLVLDLAMGAEVYVVHTPAHGFCVEPQTAWPDAANLSAAGVPGTGHAQLAAGEQLTTTTRWVWQEVPG